MIRAALLFFLTFWWGNVALAEPVFCAAYVPEGDVYDLGDNHIGVFDYVVETGEFIAEGGDLFQEFVIVIVPRPRLTEHAPGTFLFHGEFLELEELQDRVAMALCLIGGYQTS